MRIETKITLKEWVQIGKEMFSGSSVMLVHLICVICLYFAYKYYSLGSGKMFAYYIILPVGLELLTQFTRYRRLDSHKKFFIQEYSGKELTLVYHFNDKDFMIENLLTGDRTTYEYKILAEFRFTPDHLIIAAYGRQFFIFNRQTAEEQGLTDFLLKKNPDIKTERKRFLGIF